MTRPVCCRAMAIIPVALIGLCGSGAIAEQSEPAAPGRQADQQPAPSAQPPAGGSAQTPTQGLKQQPGTSTVPQGPTPAIQTPAEQKYGLPRNPKVGGTTDFD